MKNRIKSLILALILTVTSLAPAWAARTDLTVQNAPLIYGSITADAADLNFQAVTGSSGDNGNSCSLTSTTVLVTTNADASAHNLTITSIAGPLGRTGDITYSVGAGETCILGPFPLNGWRQSTGKLFFEGDDTNIQVAPVKLRFVN